MTPFLDKLAKGGPAHKAELRADALNVTPIGNCEADLEAFQDVVHRIRTEEGDGFTIQIEHPTSDTAVRYIDIVVLAIAE